MMDCIFCKIAVGQIGANVVFEDDRVLAFRDLNPQAPVHVLIIPRKHIENVSRMEEGDFPLLGGLLCAAQKVAAEEKLMEKGFRLVVNDGKDGGQTVGHVHMHLLGGRPMHWPPG